MALVKLKRQALRPTIELVRPKPVDKPLLEDHVGLAHAVASQFVRSNEQDCVRDTEEFAEALLALHRAIEGYDPEYSTKSFSSYAWLSMRNAIIHLHRKNTRQIKTTSLDAVGSNAATDDVTDPDPEVAAAMVHVLLVDHSEESDKDRSDKELLKRVYLKGERVVDLATEFGVSRVSIYNAMSRAIEKIKERHGDNQCLKN
jgi:RNA polymerase sigma factor (sigma-70 family)